MKKIKYINQFVNLRDDDDAQQFLLFNNNTVYYRSLSGPHEYTLEDYLSFAESYGNSFKLELVYE